MSHNHSSHMHPALPLLDPVLVEVTRGNAVESFHRGRAVIVDIHGHVIAAWGDVEAPVYPRSAVKALQAIPFVESGAMDAYGLGSEHLALACASHIGAHYHTEPVSRWLERIGLTADALECGSHMPGDEAAAAELIRSGSKPIAVHNNCSGKHAAMLTTALHKGEPMRGYVKGTHPVQQRILGILEMMCGMNLSDAPVGIDGCAIPTVGIPLGALAYSMARLAVPEILPDARAAAVRRIIAAWGAHPELVAGEGRYDTKVMRAAKGTALVKSGAEAVCCAVLPDQGIGIALKIDDGGSRAVEVAMTRLLHLCEIETGDVSESLSVTNRNGDTVGTVRAVFGQEAA